MFAYAMFKICKYKNLIYTQTLSATLFSLRSNNAVPFLRDFAFCATELPKKQNFYICVWLHKSYLYSLNIPRVMAWDKNLLVRLVLECGICGGWKWELYIGGLAKEKLGYMLVG